MKTINTTKARSSLYKLIDDAYQSSEPVQITDKRRNAVLISEDNWRAIQETLYLTSVPGMWDSIIEGMKTPVSECAEDINW
jgi:PHD/YefM family antitoxin component YafN of YafNO toxin-antitoxin module